MAGQYSFPARSLHVLPSGSLKSTANLTLPNPVLVICLVRIHMNSDQAKRLRFKHEKTYKTLLMYRMGHYNFVREFINFMILYPPAQLQQTASLSRFHSRMWVSDPHYVQFHLVC
jgi:hypothetical protein